MTGKVAPILIATVLAAVAALIVVGVQGVYTAATAPDTQCAAAHPAASAPPAKLEAATDYMAQGDYEFDRGDCAAAIAAYSRAITLDPRYAQAYNNRAYTRMRQHQYAAALPDLDRAIALRPDYVNALINRGDIYNYYYAIDRQRALDDYDRAIAQGPDAIRDTSVCGHRMLALHGGWSPGVLVQVATGGPDSGCTAPRAKG